MVEFLGVSKLYARVGGGRVQALADVSFIVSEGEAVVVAGDNGAGKSTLLRLISGEERPSEGTVAVDGGDVGALGRRGLARLRQRLGVIPQEPCLLRDRTAVGNVALALFARGVSRGEARTRALVALREVGLGAKPNAYPTELAAGERQRLVLAQALALKPRLLLADEPTATLDDAVAAEIIELLRGAHAAGVTLLVATRTATLAGALKARTLRLENGRLREDGVAHGVG